MGRPTTLLEGLCGHALSLGAQSIEVEYNDSRQWVFANKGDTRIRIAKYKASSPDANELRGNLYAAAKKPVRTVIGGQVYILKVGVFESFGEDSFAVSIGLAPKLDPYCATIHRKARSVSGLHLQLHQDPPPGSRRVGPATLLPGFPAFDPRNDQDPGAQRPHRKNAWAGPIHSPPCTTGTSAAIGMKGMSQGGF